MRPSLQWVLPVAGLLAVSCSEAPQAIPQEEAADEPIHERSSSSTSEAVASKSHESAKASRAPAFPEIVGVDSPIEADALWTAYYITPVTKSAPEDGRVLTFTDLAGKKMRYTITGNSFHQAELEAVAVGIDKEGRKRFGYRVEEGVWRELPPGSMGMGNRMNPLVPLVHIAADQSIYPYGSLVHVPGAEGRDFGDGNRMTGYFWVSDSGGKIKGDHFDLFVGQEEIYSGFLDIVRNKLHATKIYPLPTLETSWDPRHQSGLVRVLLSTGHLEAAAEGGQIDPRMLESALVAFQKDQPFIPAAEYGDPGAATSRWFLTQAAVRGHKAEALGGAE